MRASCDEAETQLALTNESSKILLERAGNLRDERYALSPPLVYSFDTLIDEFMIGKMLKIKKRSSRSSLPALRLQKPRLRHSHREMYPLASGFSRRWIGQNG